MNKYLFFAFFLSFWACKSEPAPTAPASTASVDTVAPPPPDGLLEWPATGPLANVEADLCKDKFETAVTLFPDTTDKNRRFFVLQPKMTYAVVITAGNSRTAFMLRQNGNKVQVLTSDQYPMCLSNRASFHIAPSGHAFNYDAERYTKFDFEVKQEGGAFKGELSWNPGMVLGSYVRSRADQ